LDVQGTDADHNLIERKNIVEADQRISGFSLVVEKVDENNHTESMF
jgi:hypothetical protein